MFVVFAFCPIGTTAREKISWEGNLSLRPQGARQMPILKRSGFFYFWRRCISSHWDTLFGRRTSRSFVKKIDIFEICEVNPDSDFYHTIMNEKVLVTWCNLSIPIVTDDEKHLIQSYAASHHLIVSSFIRDLVLDQLEEDGELEEARILKALELSYKEVYDLEEML